MSTIGQRAIVIGAGMGGLTAARALAPYFEHVVVIERDRLPTDPSTRHGVPQAKHVSAPSRNSFRSSKAISPVLGRCRYGSASTFGWSVQATIRSRSGISGSIRMRFRAH